MTDKRFNHGKMELLAPAGTVEVFEVAVEAGADAVYIGAPFFNARELARHFSMTEIAAMIDYGHEHGVKVYLAMNSLVKENEMEQAIESLAILEKLEPDAVIIQDMGLYYLLSEFFPGMRIHASTLMGGHNSVAVNKFADMGFSRVVLPREITIEEIEKIADSTNVELEVFVHGAMCFSYSGLCLFSSFQGGRSSLRGRCVQPCRRRYTWQGRGKGRGGSGYLFSMNDLEGIDLLPELFKAGVASLKIEGRMRSVSYVGNVVRAYRMALDGKRGDKNILKEAHRLLDSAMGRKPTRGYFPGPKPVDALAPQHSGNIGTYLGKVRPGRGRLATVKVGTPLNLGDRLRIHQEKSDERHGFTVKKIKAGNMFVESAAKGTVVSIELPVAAREGDVVFKVDSASGSGKSSGRPIKPGRFVGTVKKINVEKRVKRIASEIFAANRKKSNVDIPFKKTGLRKGGKGKGLDKTPLPLWFRSDDPLILRQRFPVFPEKIVINLSGEAFNRFLRIKRSGPLFRRIVWALPSVIDEDKLSFFKERINGLVKLGYKDWQIGHFGQTELFGGLGCRFYGDYTLNVLNSLSEKAILANNISGGLVSIENDRDNLSEVCRASWGGIWGMTVYGFPALFTSRYRGRPMQYDRILKSPRGESFILREAWNYTRALPIQPFSLLGDLAGLAKIGLDYGMIDLSGQPLSRRILDDVAGRIANRDPNAKAFSFNFNRTLS